MTTKLEGVKASVVGPLVEENFFVASLTQAKLLKLIYSVLYYIVLWQKRYWTVGNYPPRPCLLKSVIPTGG